MRGKYYKTRKICYKIKKFSVPLHWYIFSNAFSNMYRRRKYICEVRNRKIGEESRDICTECEKI